MTKKILLLGGTEKVGGYIIDHGIKMGHSITVLVADKHHLQDDLIESDNLTVIEGDIMNKEIVANLMKQHGYCISVIEPDSKNLDIMSITSHLVSLAEANLQAPRRMWLMGDAVLLNFAGSSTMVLKSTSAGAVETYHKNNLEILEKSDLDWSLICPGPLYHDNEITKYLRIQPDELYVKASKLGGLLPFFNSRAFNQTLSNITVSYNDIAKVMVDNLDPGVYSKKRVSLARQEGQKVSKNMIQKRLDEIERLTGKTFAG